MWWEMGGGTNSKGRGAKVGRESERKVKVKKYIGGCQFRRKKNNKQINLFPNSYGKKVKNLLMTYLI